MFDKTKIAKRVDVKEFISLLRKYKKEQIEYTEHTFFRLSEKQRKIFTCDELKRVLIEKIPFLVGLQHNQNHAVFYKYQNKNFKIILNINDRKIKIVTFYFIEEWQIPKI
jgi:hypothetical protein